MGGTQRAAKFAKYLPEFGWQPVVLTVKPIAYWGQDPSLLPDLENIEIIRTESWDPQRLLARVRPGSQRSVAAGSERSTSPGLLTWLNRNVVSFFFVPDNKRLWHRHALRAADRLLRSRKFDALLTTSPPHSSHLLGRKLARKYNLQWVADFRDSWAGGHVVFEPTVMHAGLNRGLQRAILRSASRVTCVSKGIQEQLAAVRGAANKITLIPNGFDKEDYPAPTLSGSNDFVFCYCGTISEFANPETLLAALRLFGEKYQQELPLLKFKFVGTDVTGRFAAMIQDSGLENSIEYLGYRQHRQALQYLVDADALLLIASGDKGDTFVPGKTYEYLGTGKPVLVLSNIDATTEFMRACHKAVTVGLDDVDGIVAAIREFMLEPGREDWKGQDLDLQIYDRRYQTGQLAEILDAVSASAKASNSDRRKYIS
jgi:glycosyltransferase involved in cell wall biosynthesis